MGCFSCFSSQEKKAIKRMHNKSKETPAVAHQRETLLQQQQQQQQQRSRSLSRPKPQQDLRSHSQPPSGKFLFITLNVHKNVCF